MKIIGNISPVSRVLTGLYGFDRAFINQVGNVGFPIGKGVEVFGQTHLGKSTVTYGLAGMIANSLQKNVVLADFEGFDPEFLTTVMEMSGFDGNVYCIQEEDDETALDTLLSTLRKPEYCVGILDSIGAISPVSEQDGELGEANMGRRAFLMAQFSRKGLKLLRATEPKTIFMINHAYPRIGGRGMTTPGGEVKNYISTIRIQLRRKYIKGKYEEFPDGSYIIDGEVVKNRWGLKDRHFNLFVLAGYGIHTGLTAMYDAINMGLVTRGRTMKIGDKSFGTMKEIIMKAHDGNTEFFVPFQELLNETTNDALIEEPEDTEYNEEEETEEK